jgi:hypothetical protein
MLLEVITSASVSGLLVWLTKSWISERLRNAIKNEYDQKLESHKAQLKAQSDVEIEKLRSQLSIAATEHEVTFSKLHEKRARVIAKTYSLLKKLFVCLGEYVNIVQLPNAPSKEEQRKVAAEAYQNFRSYYVTRVIFFPKPTASKLEEIDLELVKTFNRFVIEVEMSKNPDPTNKWIEIFNRVKGEIKTALDELEDEFRRLLGDEH